MACLRILTLIQLAPANYTAREARQPALFLITRSRALVLGVLFSVAFSAKRSYRGRKAWMVRALRAHLNLSIQNSLVKALLLSVIAVHICQDHFLLGIVIIPRCSLLAFLEVKQTKTPTLSHGLRPGSILVYLNFLPSLLIFYYLFVAFGVHTDFLLAW